MLNQIVIMGRMVRDPELRYTQSGTAVTSWRNTAEFAANYFSKGRMAVVEGRLQIRDWTDKDGNKRKSAEVLVGSLYFGDSKNSATKEREDPLDGLQRNAPGIVEQTEMDSMRTRGGGFSELDEDEKLPF